MGPWGWLAVSAALAAGWVLYGRKKRAGSDSSAEGHKEGYVSEGITEAPSFVPSIEPSSYEYSTYSSLKDEVRSVGHSGSGSGKADHVYYMVEYPVGNPSVPEGGYDTFQIYPNQGKGGLWVFVKRKRAGRVASDWFKFQYLSSSPEGKGSCSSLDPSAFDKSARIDEHPKGEWAKLSIDRFKPGMFDDPESGNPIRAFVGTYDVKVTNTGDVFVKWSGDSDLCADATAKSIFAAIGAP